MVGAAHNGEPRTITRAAGMSPGSVRYAQKIYSWFTEGYDTADLKEARALLDELS
jgi:hypothetical protein